MSAEKSTIVRTVQPVLTDAAAPRAMDTPIPVPAVLPRAFAGLERLAPRAGGWLAERLWFRPPPAPAHQARERRAPKGGEAFTVDWGGGTVRGRVYGQWGDPTAYLVHGWGGWWQQLAAHVEPLVEQGLCVVAFDMPSHGSSGPGRLGRSTHLIEMADALEAVVTEFGRPTLIVAHSAGCMSTLHARRRGILADAYVFIAPPHSVEPIIGGFARAMGIGPLVRERMWGRIERRAGIPLSDFDLVAQGAAMVDPPALLVVHDRQDLDAPAEGAVRLTDAWSGSDLVLTDGLGHRRVIWAPEVVQRVAALAVATAERVRRSSR